MTRKQKILMAIRKGYKYNPETGQIFGATGKELIATHTKGYRVMTLTSDKTYILLGHQFAWYWVHKEIVDKLDHINEIKSDNRIVNLRPTNNQGNHFNRTKHKGYYWSKDRKKFHAIIMVFGTRICLGFYDSEEEAKTAYLEGKEYYHIINDDKLLKERFDNRPKYEPKGYSYYEKTKKYRARIVINRKQIDLGTFDTEIEARNAYLEAVSKKTMAK